MNAEELRSLQAPVKDRYRQDPGSAIATLHSRGELDVENVVCRVKTARGDVNAGLHPFAGGDGSGACSGDMLLDALVACAGVTLGAVATNMGITLRGGTISAEGKMDFRGTMGVAKDAPIGLTSIQLQFVLDTDAPREQVEKLVQFTERYCVIYQTLKHVPEISSSVRVGTS